MFALLCLLASTALPIAIGAEAEDIPTTSVVVMLEEDPVAVLHP